MDINEKHYKEHIGYILDSFSNRKWFFDRLKDNISPLQLRTNYVKEFEPALRSIFNCPSRGKFISKLQFTPIKLESNGYSDLTIYETDGNPKFFYPKKVLNIRTSTSVFGNKWQLRVKDIDNAIWRNTDYYLLFVSHFMFVVDFKALSQYRQTSKIVSEQVNSSYGIYTKKYYNIDIIQMMKMGIAKIVSKDSISKYSIDIPYWAESSTLPEKAYTTPDPKGGKVWTFSDITNNIEYNMSINKLAKKIYTSDSSHTIRSYEEKIRRYIKRTKIKISNNEKVECLYIGKEKYIISDLFDIDEYSNLYDTSLPEKKPLPRVLNNYFNRRFSTFHKEDELISKEQKKKRMKVVSYLYSMGWDGKSMLTDELVEIRNRLSIDLGIDTTYIGKEGTWL